MVARMRAGEEAEREEEEKEAVERFLGGPCAFAAGASAAGRGNLSAVMAEWAKFDAGALRGVPSVGVEEAAALMEAPGRRTVVVDCRGADEQDVSMIPGSLRQAQVDALPGPARRELLVGEGTTVVAACTIGYRSGKYVEKLRAEFGDAVDARNLRGSLLAWSHAGRPLTDGLDPARPSARLHTYGKAWALPPDGIEAVYHAKGAKGWTAWLASWLVR